MLELSFKAITFAQRYLHNTEEEKQSAISFVRPRDGFALYVTKGSWNAHIPDSFIEFQLFERTILYFPSSPITSLYEKQAASGRAPAGMSGIFGWRVASGKTIVHNVPGFCDEARVF